MYCMKRWTKVEVKWLDSCHLCGWQDMDDVTETKVWKSLTQMTMGYIFLWEDDFVTLVQSFSDENDSVDGVFSIPRVCILSTKKL